MNPALEVTRGRLERLVADRARNAELIEGVLQVAENEQRDLSDSEQSQVAAYRERLPVLDKEIDELVGDLERAESTADASRFLRTTGRRPADQGADGDGDAETEFRYGTFAAYARDAIVAKYPEISNRAGGDSAALAARERLELARESHARTIEHTLTADIEGLVPPAHLAQIMDLISTRRPVVESARKVPLTSGKLTYPRITQRPEVLKQSAEKTEAGNQKMTVDLDDLTADTYLGAGNLSWQALNWSTPDALGLFLDLMAEEYARKTEIAACAELESVATTIDTPLTSGDDFEDWLKAVLAGVGDVYDALGGRGVPGAVYVAPDRFFELAGLTSAANPQLITSGQISITTLRGTFAGLQVIGSFGFTAGTAIVGDSSALLVGETPNAPVELRAVEPAIGGMEVGLIGAFSAKVFDDDRFVRLTAPLSS